MDEVFSVTTSFLDVYLLFRLAPFAKNLLKEDEEELFVLLTTLRSAGRRRSSLAYKGLSKKLFALFWPRNCSIFGATGNWVCY